MECKNWKPRFYNGQDVYIITWFGYELVISK